MAPGPDHIDLAIWHRVIFSFGGHTESRVDRNKPRNVWDLKGEIQRDLCELDGAICLGGPDTPDIAFHVTTI